MQSGIENVPFYIQQNPLALYPSQGINIFLSPALSINPSQNFISSNPSMSSAYVGWRQEVLMGESMRMDVWCGDGVVGIIQYNTIQKRILL